LKRIGQALLQAASGDSSLSEFNELLARSLRAAYEYWLREEDPEGGSSRRGRRAEIRGTEGALVEGISTGVCRNTSPGWINSPPRRVDRGLARSARTAGLPGNRPAYKEIRIN